jgi:TetR/AcrR family transcriptional repressor of multidrug resistance operon
MRAKDEKKDWAIRETALQMIVKEGFKGLSMQKLAKKANVSPGTIYIYYKDRNDLLNKLYIEVIDRTHKAVLIRFNPEMEFSKGLKLLWLNRYRHYIKYPNDFYFSEQFINSPLIKSLKEKEDQAYRKQMEEFYNNAVGNGEIPKLALEVYWTIAFAPLYHLIKFNLQEVIYPLPHLHVSEKKLLVTLELVLKALKK